ncbi:MAG: molybdenum cofactor guanylyltransferase [bacterium]|nr:molybdenum cofactor guanylyltransferase [bacterium]
MKKLHDDITAFILSGGKSSRMGTNKSLLKVGNKSLLQRIIEILESIFSEVVISSNELELFELFKKKIIKDIYPDRGPISGIHSALYSTKTEKNFFISCDMPLINKELINYLINFKSDKDIILPKAEGKIQQLCGVYSKKIFPQVDKLINESMKKDSKLKGSIYELQGCVETEIVDVSGLDYYHLDLFFNINTPEDFNYAKRILGEEDK